MGFNKKILKLLRFFIANRYYFTVTNFWNRPPK